MKQSRRNKLSPTTRSADNESEVLFIIPSMCMGPWITVVSVPKKSIVLTDDSR